MGHVVITSIVYVLYVPENTATAGILLTGHTGFYEVVDKSVKLAQYLIHGNENRRNTFKEIFLTAGYAVILAPKCKILHSNSAKK